MTSQGTNSGQAPNVNFDEKRHEKRYAIPNACRPYITLQVKTGNDYVPAVLGNFSRNGILFESGLPLEAGSEAECVIAVSLLVARKISLKIQVKYCFKNDDSYIIGAAIERISDENWFDVFVEIHDFIALNKDSVRPAR